MEKEPQQEYSPIEYSPQELKSRIFQLEHRKKDLEDVIPKLQNELEKVESEIARLNELKNK